MRLNRTIERIAAMCIIALGCYSAGEVRAQSGDRIESSSIDVNTRWAFRTLSPVTVGSPIVRLRDVIKPLDPEMAGWQRLSSSPIGLVPLGGQAMVISRSRLSKAIRNAEATPVAIDWVGPDEIKVVYREGTPSVSQVSFTTPSNQNGTATNAVAPTSIGSGLSSAAAQPILTWIHTALDRQHESIVETYAVEIDHRQPALQSLRWMVSIPEIEILDKNAAGDCRFHIVGRSANGPCDAVIQAKLTAHPLVVYARTNMQRGHRISAHDLLVQPLPQEKVEPSLVTEADALIGMEVRGTIRQNRPISRNDVGMPILIRRGDLVDIRVVGGGVSVTTRAKAVEEGSESDTIEVETLSPRKRLLARVVQTGLVEIVTRAPRVN